MEPGAVVLHYRIIEKIGQGGGGGYRAEDLKLGRPVALKVLHEHLQAAGYDSGADGYVVDPIDPKLLVAAVWARVRQWEQNDALRQALQELQAAKDGLERHHQLLQALMEYIPEGITIADAPDVTIREVRAISACLRDLGSKFIRPIQHNSDFSRLFIGLPVLILCCPGRLCDGLKGRGSA